MHVDILDLCYRIARSNADEMLSKLLGGMYKIFGFCKSVGVVGTYCVNALTPATSSSLLSTSYFAYQSYNFDDYNYMRQM